MLRFDVETISKATYKARRPSDSRLRFDVETISKATSFDNIERVLVVAV